MLEQMRERYLSGMEDFRYAWSIVKEYLSYYLLLMLLVYLPIQVVLHYQSIQLDLTVESAELLMAQLGRYGVVELVVTLLEEVAILVIAVITSVSIDPSLMKDKSFSTVFYHGIRMWPRAVLTLVVILLGVAASIFAMSVFAMIPIVGLVVIGGVFLLVVLIVLLQSCTATTAALRGRMGFDNIRYVFFILQGRAWKAMGTFAIVSILSLLLQTGVTFLLTLAFSWISQDFLQMIVSVLIATVLSLITMYGYTVGAVLFIGAEYRKESLLTQNP
ncbi:MAG: hypothetical protein IJM83_11220 [Firmicutes bacterium]|nr:hypothetical protein [Bacillota bacterium]